MARKEKLPDNASSFVDRHGKRRYRWRSKGRSRYIHAHPNSALGKAELASFEVAQDNRPSRHAPGTVGWLAERYLASPAFLGNKGERFERVSRAVLDKFVAKFAAGRIADFRFDQIEAILTDTAKPWKDARGKKRGGPFR